MATAMLMLFCLLLPQWQQVGVVGWWGLSCLACVELLLPAQKAPTHQPAIAGLTPLVAVPPCSAHVVCHLLVPLPPVC